MLQLLNAVDDVRIRVSNQIAPSHKSEWGQFMTPSNTARFMASLFSDSHKGDVCRLLDAGAGMGALTCAFLERYQSGGFSFKSIESVCYEIDPHMRLYLQEHLQLYPDINSTIYADDFIEQVTSQPQSKQYTHVILNPPYKKINSNSKHRLALRQVGIETVNLYSAFLALAISLTAPNGQIVAIVPRSFCNGSYYRHFREYLLAHCQIRHLHLFESRSKAFKDDNVLQENVILRLELSRVSAPITISTSVDDSFCDLESKEHPFDSIVFPNDPEKFIHIPTSLEKNILDLSPKVSYSLAGLGLSVSTGAIVDFRVREHLRDMPEKDTVPLIYPIHFKDGARWPRENIKKPNAIMRNSETEKWLYPMGYYCVVRRFSSKEEKRRINANVVDPEVFSNAPILAFENRMNVFHNRKSGIPQTLAYGLTAFLNTTAVDDCFRRYNGHTQVNVTELKAMKYPNKEILMELGKWIMLHPKHTQAELDAQLHILLT